MIGWIAGLCDPENYGTFIAYQFPKDKRILGPQQVETKIDQDAHLSGQLSLWDQRGSNVIRGNVLAIPVENTIIYVEPIYLQAETAAYPELRLVAVMHNDDLSYAESFDEALSGIFDEDGYEQLQAVTSDGQIAIPGQTEQADETQSEVGTLIQQANQAFEDYLRFTGEKRFSDASQALDRLQELLNETSENQGNNNDTLPGL